ncbi:hypothetical protein [Endozoicomonas sp. SCSIO W0465]|uniref:hypothetical protein n=1 Tax=Endozoicomonas sp. SCSIO W0465 TaxID=2918516 RepID=UPI002074AF6A|nr:hypothetical protein [Endozoicomonas sp. SCSIO W0465]USE36153.1 hypothetical protein MJO57_29615 [Endozoicomonas sp. SCSIO W0465]
MFIARHPFLKEVAIVCHGKGLPEDMDIGVLFQRLGVLWALQKMKGIDNAVKYKPLDQALVTHIFSICNNKSLPKQTRVNAFLQLRNVDAVRVRLTMDAVRVRLTMDAVRVRLTTFGKSKPEKGEGKSA